VTIPAEDLAFIKEHAPDLPFVGGVGAEIWRPAGIEESLRHIQIMEKLGYTDWGFTEQTQSWTFRSVWGLMPDSTRVPEYEAFYDTTCLIAAAGMQTSKIRFSLITDCYRRPPSVMAQTLKTLDQTIPSAWARACPTPHRAPRRVRPHRQSPAAHQRASDHRG
jgi:hypothetical protein